MSGGTGAGGHDGKGYAGPGYWDVRNLCLEIERTFDVKVDFLVGPEDNTRRWQSSALWVRCRAYRGPDPWKGALWGSMPMGGSNGAKTLPGAMMGALQQVWEQLAEGGMFPVEQPPA